MSGALCGFRWAWEGRDEPIHKCRHEDAHPGRHVCWCRRSWQDRDAAREKAQGVTSRPSATAGDAVGGEKP